MATVHTKNRPVTETSLLAFFHRSIDDAARNQRLEAADATLVYLANLLTDYARAERLFDYTSDGTGLRPLALQYADALETRSRSERRMILQRLGDVALFVSGLFAGALSRRSVGVDYYIAMGGSAYAYLVEDPMDHGSGRLQGDVFRELSLRFARFVDVIAEVGRGQVHRQSPLLPGANEPSLEKLLEGIDGIPGQLIAVH
ncbi:MAG: hypothetical protein KDH88_04530 [Chromatiales bacterium]|nr:hypothetical protein [Chromatiales bacterium]